MSVAELGQRESRVGRVLGTSIERLPRNFIRFHATAAIMSVPPPVFDCAHAFLWGYAGVAVFSQTGTGTGR